MSHLEVDDFFELDASPQDEVFHNFKSLKPDCLLFLST